ncbi:helix-turn-helix domain-containing protein [Kocuria massiliensis]|uniref:helix-turn-helix domain-containing protein n=1 Tax=Kocuria massiliensis TaxID=1926282 RepID=UPI003B3BD749
MSTPRPYTPEELAAARHLLGLSNTDMAQLCGVGDRRVRAWMNGESHPSPAAADRLQQALSELTQQADAELAAALRSRARPVRLSVQTPRDLPVQALVSAMLAIRGIECRLDGTQ